jgi:pimeloyl-ACP methyl ester carboxylesterase
MSQHSWDDGADESYVTGQSMGGAATQLAAERYGDRLDGALALCGAAGQTSAAAITTDIFVAGAYAAGVTQRELDRTTDLGRLIDDRVRPALRRPAIRRRFEDLAIALSGGPRTFDRESLRFEEETNWERAALLVTAGIALWTFANRNILYGRQTRAWPGRGGGRARLDTSFSTAAPEGAVPPQAEFAGEVFRTDGRQLPGGTRIDAYVGTTRCGVTSVRRTGSFSGFSLDVAGPDSVPGCARGATITFRVAGRAARDTAVNEPGRSARLDLTVP